MLLAARGIDATGVDSFGDWAPLWQRTLAESDAQAELIQGDVREFKATADLVISNPPFFPAGSGPVSGNPFRAAARTESTATLADFVDAGLRAAARVVMIAPRHRERELLFAMQSGVHVVSRHVRVGRKRVLIEARVSADRGACQTFDETDPRVARWYALATGAG
jgi:tRNA1(Val) A37 N6-methylase TrmN6